MENSHIWNLIARKLSGEASRQELEELEALQVQYPELENYIKIFSKWWHSSNSIDPTPIEHAFQRHLDRMEKAGVTFDEPPPILSLKSLPPPKKKRIRIVNPFEGPLMIQGYFKIGWRNLVHGRVFSIINILGLAIGMASAMLIFLWIHHELTYERFHKNKDRIYLAYSRGNFDGKIEAWDGSSMLLGPILKLNYPEVELAARVNNVAAFVFHAGDKHLQAHGLLTDASFLKMFDFPLLQGDANTALSSDRSVVITEGFAKKLFGSEDAMGKMLRIDSNSHFLVTGILKKLPSNTRFDFEYLVPWSYMKEVHWDRPDWESAYISTYVMLKEGITRQVANTRFRDIIRKHSSRTDQEMFLHPLAKLRLWNEFENGKVVGGYIRTVQLFGVIAAFILLIACINYMNLSTARSLKRAREVGIRKVTGAGKNSLIAQFLIESLVVTIIAGVVALILVEPSLNWFNQLTYKNLFIPYGNFNFWLFFAGFIFLTGMIAGSYPAFYLSSFQPLLVLKGTFKSVGKLVTPRKLLVVLQFTFSVILIICTIVIHKQIRYGLTRDAGFKQDNLAFVFLKGDMQKKYSIIKKELFERGAITSITRTNSPIVQVWNNDHTYEWEGRNKNAEKPGLYLFHTDGNFAKTMGLKIIAGRDIDPEKFPTDSTAILINESALKLMALKNPIGMQLRSHEGTWHIVGIVNDFIPTAPFASVHLTVIQGPGAHHWFGTVTFELNGEKSTSDNLKIIGDVLKRHNPDYPFEYYFADSEYAVKFQEEKRHGSLAGIFAGLTIFISCLGLFALAAYMAENRAKEIGVRKVLGASVPQVWLLLSKDFIFLVTISCVIASPIAFYLLDSWLAKYQYRVSIGPGVFILAALAALSLTIMTVSVQAIKAAIANPAKSLRTE